MSTRVFFDEKLAALRSFPAIGTDELIRYFPYVTCFERQIALSRS